MFKEELVAPKPEVDPIETIVSKIKSEIETLSPEKKKKYLRELEMMMLGREVGNGEEKDAGDIKKKYLIKIQEQLRSKKPVKQERQNELFELLLACIKAEKFIEGNRINPLEFEFQDDERDEQMAAIRRDDEKAATLQKKFESQDLQEAQRYGKVLEAIVAQYIEKGWFGETALSKNTSLYDDFINKVDVIVELEREGYKKHMGLAIDATFSNKLSDKFNSIKGKIAKGELGKLRYYKSDNFQGRISHLPEMVVGVEIAQLKKLIKLWINEDEEALRNHPIQNQILKEISLQLTAFIEYAKLLPESEVDSKKKKEMIAVYRRLQNTVGFLITARKKEVPEAPVHDRLYLEIKRICQKFGKDHDRI